MKNICWRSNGYYTCNQVVNGTSAALVVFTHTRGHAYAVTSLVPGQAPNVGELIISGARWTYPWRDTDAAKKPLWLRIINDFRSPHSIAYRQEYSYDNVHWTVMARGRETKRG